MLLDIHSKKADSHKQAAAVSCNGHPFSPTPILPSLSLTYSPSPILPSLSFTHPSLPQIQVAGQVDLNFNNSLEVLTRAAQVRRRKFLRTFYTQITHAI